MFGPDWDDGIVAIAKLVEIIVKIVLHILIALRRRPRVCWGSAYMAAGTPRIEARGTSY